MSDDSNLQQTFVQEPLTIIEHQDPELHSYGDALYMPVDEEVVSFASVKSAGSSNAPARADHSHGFDNIVARASATGTWIANETKIVTGYTLVETGGFNNVDYTVNANGIVVPHAGLIMIEGYVYFTAIHVNPAYFQVDFAKNGSSAEIVSREGHIPFSTTVSTTIYIPVKTIQTVAAGDSIGLSVTNSNAYSCDVTAVLRIAYLRIT